MLPGMGRAPGMRHSEHSEGDGSISRYDPLVSTTSDTAHTLPVEGAQDSETKMVQPSGDGRPVDLVSSLPLPKPIFDSAFEPCIPAASRKYTLHTHTEFHDLESPGQIKHPLEIEGFPDCEENTFNGVLPLIDSKTTDSDGKGTRDETNAAFQCSTAPLAEERVDINNQAMPKSLGCEKHQGQSKFSGSYLSRTEDDRKVSSNIVEIDYAILESSSFSETEANAVQHNSPNSLSRNEFIANEGSHKEVPDDPNLSDESSAAEAKSSTSSGSLDTNEKSGMQDMETYKFTEAAQEEANKEKRLCALIYMEDFGNQFSEPVYVVSSSCAAAAPGLVGATLQLEGNLGWKGFATSGSSVEMNHRNGSQNHAYIAESIDADRVISLVEDYKWTVGRHWWILNVLEMNGHRKASSLLAQLDVLLEKQQHEESISKTIFRLNTHKKPWLNNKVAPIKKSVFRLEFYFEKPQTIAAWERHRASDLVIHCRDFRHWTLKYTNYARQILLTYWRMIFAED